MTMMFEGSTKVFKFDQTQMAIIFSYKRYFNLFKKETELIGVFFNRNLFLLYRDQNYLAKGEQVLGFFQDPKQKHFME